MHSYSLWRYREDGKRHWCMEQGNITSHHVDSRADLTCFTFVSTQIKLIFFSFNKKWQAIHALHIALHWCYYHVIFDAYWARKPEEWTLFFRGRKKWWCDFSQRKFAISWGEWLCDVKNIASRKCFPCRILSFILHNQLEHVIETNYFCRPNTISVTFKNRINLLWTPIVFFCPHRLTVMPTITFMCGDIDCRWLQCFTGWLKWNPKKRNKTSIRLCSLLQRLQNVLIGLKVFQPWFASTFERIAARVAPRISGSWFFIDKLLPLFLVACKTVYWLVGKHVETEMLYTQSMCEAQMDWNMNINLFILRCP